ncbi:MAG: hypothetical protein JW781_07390 [Deltaproteobacteria bacterium]|nr:hypothetical protein [Candidatus Anaeroferrophillacea bacterium]
MAGKPNYGYEKRQRELAKKAKKEKKQERRQQQDPVPADEQTEEDRSA